MIFNQYTEKETKETNLYLQNIKEEQKKNQRFMLIEAVDKQKVLSVWNSSQNCEFMLYDMSKDNNIYSCLYDSLVENKESLKEALDYIAEYGMALVGNTKWIPAFA